MSDALFGIHATALSLGRARMDVLAANIANADTPRYLAKDIDFAAALKAQSSGPGQLVTTSHQHLALGSSAAGGSVAEVWRTPLQPSADGNTVDVQIEQSQFAEAALKYQASLNFLDSRVRSLLTAITGQ